MGERAHMKESDLARVPLIVTELATNLVQHATGGEIIIRMLPVEAAPGLEIVALDRGPGIADLRRCMTDGYSGSGTRGCGLGAVRRLSTGFDIYSMRPSGTVVISRVSSIDGEAPALSEFSAISIPAPNEIECGDTWQLRFVGHNLSVIVVDGLGHGPLAAKAAAEGLVVFGDGSFEGPLAYFEAAHSSLNPTRGAAIAVAQVNNNQRKLHYAGVGNITGHLISCGTGKSTSLISQNGIVGTTVRKLQQFDYKWEDGDLLIMHSDGLTDRWNISDYPGLARADTAVIAAVIYRDTKRGRDDSTVLVVRLKTRPLQ
jgi:anti-sigma regulatory factor (Ser/Thr protein kinase)